MKFDEFFQRVTLASGISTQKELAVLLGVDPAAITLAKSRGVPKAWGYMIASRLGINSQWLATGSGQMLLAGASSTVLVPKVAARACAGGGSLDLDSAVVAELPFNREWLRVKGDPKHMVAMDVVGDSMSPELEPGDTLLIDQSQTAIRNMRLYVVGLSESLQIKRVQERPGVVVLFSANPRFAPVTLQGDEIDTLRVIGRVLWSSRAYA